MGRGMLWISPRRARNLCSSSPLLRLSTLQLRRLTLARRCRNFCQLLWRKVAHQARPRLPRKGSTKTNFSTRNRTSWLRTSMSTWKFLLRFSGRKIQNWVISIWNWSRWKTVKKHRLKSQRLRSKRLTSLFPKKTKMALMKSMRSMIRAGSPNLKEKARIFLQSSKPGSHCTPQTKKTAPTGQAKSWTPRSKDWCKWSSLWMWPRRSWKVLRDDWDRWMRNLRRRVSRLMLVVRSILRSRRREKLMIS